MGFAFISAPATVNIVNCRRSILYGTWLLPTAYVVPGKVMFSVCPHLGGYHGQVRWGGYPTLGTPHQTWPGVYPGGGVPHLGYPPSDLAGGYPWQRVPHLGYSPVRPGWGGYPAGGIPEYLICHGRYVFCVHAGGLSCYLLSLEIRCLSHFLRLNFGGL